MHIFWILLSFMALYIVRAIKGPAAWDRLLALNLISTKIILIVILYASLNATAYLLDFAISYALIGFIGVIFVALFLVKRRKETSDKWR